MKFAAMLYTAGAVAVLAAIVLRPWYLDVNTVSAAPTPEGETSTETAPPAVNTNAVPTTPSAAPQATETTGAPATPDASAAPAPTDQPPVAMPAATPEAAPETAPTATPQPITPAAPVAPTAPANDGNTGGQTNVMPDYEREQRMAGEITDMILDGDVMELNDGAQDFMAIYTETETSPARGTVIIAHGRGFHPDWADVVNPLRVGLTASGWNTLSLQMPVLEKEAKYYDYVPLFSNASKRIQAGIDYLKSVSAAPIVLVGHSCGAHMAMQWVREHNDADIKAYVGLGMGATDYKQPMREPFPLASMKVPVLDLYGADEFPAVIKMAPERLAMMQQAGNAQSKQATVMGANHYFNDKGEELTAAVAEWLNSLTL